MRKLYRARGGGGGGAVAKWHSRTVKLEVEVSKPGDFCKNLEIDPTMQKQSQILANRNVPVL